MELPGLEAMRKMFFEKKEKPENKKREWRSHKSRHICYECMSSTKRVYFEDNGSFDTETGIN